MTDLILLRHGETEWNRQRRIQGLSDIPLNDTGRRQAREAGETLLPDFAGEASAIVVSSDLSRAAETARIIAEVLGLPGPRQYPGLRERGYGEAEGTLVEDVPTLFGSSERDLIPGAESGADLRERALRALDEVAADASRDAPGAAIIAVTHGALIAEVLRHASAGLFPRPGDRIPNGRGFRLRVGPDGVSLDPDAATSVGHSLHNANRA